MADDSEQLSLLETERCPCGNVAEFFCDFMRLSKPISSIEVEKDIQLCSAPLCSKCTYRADEYNGFICGGPHSGIYHETVDYCPRHKKIFDETGRDWEYVAPSLINYRGKVYKK